MKKPTIKKIREFGREIMGFDLPKQSKVYKGWENQLHELGHWAVIPDFMLALRLGSRYPSGKLAQGSIPEPCGVSLAEEAWQALFGDTRTRIFEPKENEDGTWSYYRVQYIHYCWFGHQWIRRGGYCQGEDALPLIPNEWGVIAWCNQVCDVMGWHRPAKQFHCQEPSDPDQLLVAGIFPERGIFRPSHEYSVSFHEQGISLDIRNERGWVQRRLADYGEPCFRREVAGAIFLPTVPNPPDSAPDL
jgi:hypothetical protein